MTASNSNQENGDTNEYYHPDPRLAGWTFVSISPMDSPLAPLLGKTIVNMNSDPKRAVVPKSTIDTDSQKRTYNASFPFGHSEEIDALIAKKKKSTPQSTTSQAKAPILSTPTTTSTRRVLPGSTQNTVVSRRVLPGLSAQNALQTAAAITPILRTPSLKISAPTNKYKKVVLDPELYKGLSEEQKRIHDSIVNDKKTVFFSGSAGTGKSVLLRAIINTLQTKYEEGEVGVTGSTGIAALNIGGVTLYKFTHIGLGEGEVGKLIEKIESKTSTKNDWLRVKVLIIDEISMVDGFLLDKLDCIARTVRRQQKVFGGIQLVISGDFYQLPPIVKKGKEGILAFEARCWSQMIEKNFILKTCFRQKDKEFVRMLNEIRVGRVSEETERVFKALSRRPASNVGIKPADLYPSRKEVDKENAERLALLSGEERTYEAKDIGNRQILESCMAPALLALKVGAQVMLIKNLESTLVNGSMGIVVGFSETNKMPIVQFSNGRKMTMSEETWEFDLPRQPKTVRTQVPLILAWALTIHKSQGQTIEYVRVNLGQTFEMGQAYVALSRATCMEQLQVLNFRKELVRAHPKVTEFYNRIDVDE